MNYEIKVTAIYRTSKIITVHYVKDDIDRVCAFDVSKFMAWIDVNEKREFIHQYKPSEELVIDIPKTYSWQDYFNSESFQKDINEFVIIKIIEKKLKWETQPQGL